MTTNLRILLTDIMFPNKFAKWRLVTTKAFIEKYDTDILVISRVNSYRELLFEFDFDELRQSHSLNEYDILIFNPSFNYINKYNSSDFDGTKFNNKYRGDYILRKKKFRSEVFNISVYDAVYHIFLLCYKNFNTNYSYSFAKQFIHLYPGGGLIRLQNAKEINPCSKIISTQNYTTEYLQTNLINKFINVYCAPFLNKYDQIRKKSINNNNIGICFTSLGIIEEKGAHIYPQIVKIYKNMYPDDKIIFYSVGLVPMSDDIIHFAPMSQKKLDDFYYHNVDILLNLDTNKALNGFPLGVEGTLQGTILFTTDSYNLNVKNNFNYGEEMLIIKNNDIDHIITNIHKLHDDRILLNQRSLAIQEKSYQLFNYENTMVKIFDFIEDNLSEKNIPKEIKLIDLSYRETNQILELIPSDFIGGGNDNKKNWMINTIIKNNFQKCVEIGVWRGRSFAPMVIATKYTNGHAYGIDPYTAENMNELDAPNNVLEILPTVINTINFEKVYQDVTNNITKKYINCSIIRKTAENAIHDIPDDIDLLHIDGNHDTELVSLDIKLYVPKVKPTGYIIMDDTDWPSVQKALYLLNDIAIKIEQIDSGWSIYQKK